MSIGIWRITHGGPGNIIWERLPDTVGQAGEMIRLAGDAGSVLAAGFSLVSVVQNQVIIHKLNAVARDVKNIKARFDLLFLDRSIDYFLSGHSGRVGLNRAILEALLEDCQNALHQIVDNSDLNVPGFLRHRVQVLSKALHAFNQLHYAVAHGGEINWLEQSRVQEWAKGISSLQGASPEGGLCSQSIVVEAWKSELALRETQKTSGIRNPFGKDGRPLVDLAVLPGNYDRASDVLILAREADAAVKLLGIVNDRLLSSKKEMMIRAAG